ncbi:podocalyxin [Macrotis lagotis]|uniref:podocalyxin n=1 Tax=Macrotis lagotis TaxID=92651 RepID=UPI003D68CD53
MYVCIVGSGKALSEVRVIAQTDKGQEVQDLRLTFCAQRPPSTARESLRDLQKLQSLLYLIFTKPYCFFPASEKCIPGVPGCTWILLRLPQWSGRQFSRVLGCQAPENVLRRPREHPRAGADRKGPSPRSTCAAAPSPRSRGPSPSPPPLGSRPGRSFLLLLIVPNPSGRPAPPPPRAAPGGGRGGGRYIGAGARPRPAAAAPSRSAAQPPAPQAAARRSQAPGPRPPVPGSRSQAPGPGPGLRVPGPRSQAPGSPRAAPGPALRHQRRSGSGGARPSPASSAAPAPGPGREDRMRSPPPALLPPLLLLLLPLPPTGVSGNEATTKSLSTLKTYSTSETQKSTIPATPVPPLLPPLLPPEGQSSSKSPTTPKPNEAGSTAAMPAQPTTSPTVNTSIVESAKKTTPAPSKVPSTSAVPLTSQVAKSSPLATTQDTIITTSQDASIEQTALNVSVSPTSLTSLNIFPPVPRSPNTSLPATSTKTNVATEYQSTLANHESTVKLESTVSVTLVGTVASVAPEGTFPVNSESTASVTSGVISSMPKVVSENSTSLATSTYFSHHQPPALTTSGSEIFSPIPNKVTCQADGHLTENLLILKMTNFSICDGIKDPRNHPLYTALCRAGKANFNKDRDLCHVQLISQPEKQEVAVLNVAVQTHLQPKELYEVLKKRWDDLKALGVSNMTYGNESLDKEVEDRFSMPLIITIVCMAAFLLLVAALYGCFHQRFTQRKDQQRLTEELQTVENGYHDNPTLEVMETSSEMQEKKVANLNGELGDSWIVPLDNLTKDDLDQEEEDTHL